MRALQDSLLMCALYTPADDDSGTEWIHPHLSHTLVTHPPRANLLHKHGGPRSLSHTLTHTHT